MSNIKVKVVRDNTIGVRVGQQNAVKVVTQIISNNAIDSVNSLENLTDVDTSSVNDKYIMMYNSSNGKYEFVNPDTLLVSAITDPLSPGLPAQFIDELDKDLDNKIDIDGGGF